MYHVLLAFRFVYGCGNEEDENGDMRRIGEGRDYIFSCLQMILFCVVGWKRGLKINADKNKVVLDGKEGLECEVCIDGM